MRILAKSHDKARLKPQEVERLYVIYYLQSWGIHMEGASSIRRLVYSVIGWL